MIKTLIALTAALALGVAEAAAEARFSRAELVLGVKPLSEAYMKLLEPEARDSAGGRRLERIFAHVLEHAKRRHPQAQSWDWQLVLVAKDLVAPFALPDGRIFVSPKWVAGRRLTDAEIALLLAMRWRMVPRARARAADAGAGARSRSPRHGDRLRGRRAGIAALTLFDKMARAESGPSYLRSHHDALKRKLALTGRVADCAE